MSYDSNDNEYDANSGGNAEYNAKSSSERKLNCCGSFLKGKRCGNCPG